MPKRADHLVHVRTWVSATLVALLVATGSVARAQPAPAPAPPPPTPLAGVVAPKLVRDAPIVYPEGAHGDATVVLTVVVDKDGSVREAEPLVPSPPFSEIAAKAVRAFVYEPATRNGAPIVAKIRVRDNR